ncbi:MAG: alcohol dehydrogenase catalytic domain-containing protein [Promethearchaeota archaeon]
MVNLAARYYAPGKIEVEEEDEPEPIAGEVLVKVKNSGICGTDYHIYKGEIRGLVEPGVVLGHEFSGVIEALGEGVDGTKLNEGDLVAIEPNLYCGKCHYCRNAKKHFCENWSAVGLSRDGGFEEHVSVPLQAIYKVPKGLSLEKAAFFEPMACVLHGIERGRVRVGEYVVVQGAGSIGQLYIQALKNLGVGKIIVSDIDDSKLKLAERSGADVVVNPNKEGLREVVMSETDGMGVQVFIDAAGVLGAIKTGMEVLENTGRIVIFGVPPEGAKAEVVPYEIYRREIEIIGSFTNPYTNEAALEMLKKVDVSGILTNKIKLEEIVDKGMEVIGTPGVLKVQIEF